MERIDAPGLPPDPRAAFTPELLAEVDDEELDEIVRRAARELGAPIALVSLVLDHIQLFKAQSGLPPDLAAARATDRESSFCQFVVRDGRPFEVGDAASDLRVPRQLVEQYSIRAYLGMPVRIGGAVVGSLCVIDTEPHVFTEEQRATLARLAELVTTRLGELVSSRRRAAPSVADRAGAPVAAELVRMLGLIQGSAGSGLMATAAVAAYLRLSEHVQAGGETPPEMLEASRKTARRAQDEAEDAFFNIQANTADVEDGVRALQDVLEPREPPRLSVLLGSGRELARWKVPAAGAVRLASPDYDPIVATPRALGVALVATSLSTLAARAVEDGVAGELSVSVRDLGSRAELAIEVPVGEAAIQALERELSRRVQDDPTVSVQAERGCLRLRFAVARPEPDSD